MTDDLECALAMADLADALTMSRFGAPDLRVTTKPDLTPVSEADTQVESRLRALLREVRPDDVVVGEEEGGTLAVPGRRWIIDPIDGTKNYVRSVPVWATLIALVVGSGTPHDEVVLGVVSAPALARRWWAARGEGAWATAPGHAAPRRLQVSAVARLADASFSYSDDVGWQAAALTNLRRTAWRTRAYGDFWSHLLVAEGGVDLAAEPELNAWDVAALIPIVEEAGGRISGYDGSSALSGAGALTSNGLLHDEALGILRG